MTPDPGADRVTRTAAAGGDEPAVVRAGRYAWAALGILGVLAVAGLLAARFALVLVPVVLALFPAALLAPAAGWLKRRGLPPAAAAAATLGGTVAVLAAAVVLIVPAVANELPRLVASATQGLAELEAALPRLPGIDADSLPGSCSPAPATPSPTPATSPNASSTSPSPSPKAPSCSSSGWSRCSST